jgi:hypothetical protein
VVQPDDDQAEDDAADDQRQRPLTQYAPTFVRLDRDDLGHIANRGVKLGCADYVNVFNNLDAGGSEYGLGKPGLS